MNQQMLYRVLRRLAFATAFSSFFAWAADEGLLNLVRQDDTVAIEALLKSGADPNVRDETGATALMYAVAYASPECVRLLLKAGANVNSINRNGSTALMWATGDAAKVRLLLGRHADVNARTRAGVTALLSATNRGEIEVMRMLIAAGADLQAEMALWFGPKVGLLQIAYGANDSETREVLRGAGVKLQEATALGMSPLSRLFMNLVFSYRRQTSPTSAGTVKALLDRGANPNEDYRQLTLAMPVLAQAALHGDLETMRILIERGADPNRKGPRGLTPLMMAAAASQANPAGIRLLLERGAAVAARDASGRTALDWALLQGESDVSSVLRQAGAAEMVSPAAAPAPVSKARAPRTAVEMALARLQPAGPAFYEKTKCISCHHQSLPAIAVKIAAAKGIAADREAAQHPTQATLEVWGPSREDFMLGNCSIFGFLGNVTYGLLGLAEEGVPPNSTTDAVTSCLVTLQNTDGSWEGGDIRPPLAAQNPIVYTALAIRGLKVYSPPGRRKDTAGRIARASNFLRAAIPTDTQGEAFKLLGLVWFGAPPVEVSRQAKRLLATQREEGGWGQEPGLGPDAYASGEALYALQASGMASSNPAYRKGVAYLLRTQREDGTWYVHSRAVGFQPYIDSGFPHGPDQFISAAATSWAVIALAHTL
jgi:ankyrin repeat protein